MSVQAKWHHPRYHTSLLLDPEGRLLGYAARISGGPRTGWWTAWAARVHLGECPTKNEAMELVEEAWGNAPKQIEGGVK